MLELLGHSDLGALRILGTSIGFASIDRTCPQPLVLACVARRVGR
jgi:hypothetical protein